MARAMILQYFLQIFGVLILLVKTAGLLFHPTLMIDEAYYVGAAQAVLQGDVLLQNYSFDKPFLLPYWPIIGLMSFGMTPFGARVTGLICYLVSFIVFQKVLNRIENQPIRNWVLVLSVYLLPLMLQHGASAMTEPYLLLMMSLFLNELMKPSRSEQDRESGESVFRYFWIGFFTKFTMIFWLPSLVFTFWAPRTWLSKGWATIKKAKIWIALFFIASLVNATKFSSITWFAGLGSNGATGVLVASETTWLHKLFQALGGSLGVALLLIPVVMMLLRSSMYFFSQKKVSYFSKLIVLPMVLQFLIILYSGARGYDRYLITLVPGLLLCFAAISVEYKWLSQSRLARLLIGILLIVYAVQNWNRTAEPLDPDTNLGREIMLLSKEYDREGVLLHTDYVWQTRPFTRNLIMSGCVSDACIQEHRIGAAASHDQVDQFVHSNPDGESRLKRLPGQKSKIVHETISISTEEIRSKILEKLRLKRAMINPEFVISEDGIFDLRGSIKTYSVSIRGVLFLNEWARYPKETNFKQLTLVSSVNQFQVEGIELVDPIMQVFYQGYTLHLLPIETKRAQVPNEVSLRFVPK